MFESWEKGTRLDLVIREESGASERGQVYEELYGPNIRSWK